MLRDLEVFCLTTFGAPFSGGREVVLPAGETFTVRNDPPCGATAVYAAPDSYRKLHKRFVRRRDRWHPFYSGYCLVIAIDVIEYEGELVSGAD